MNPPSHPREPAATDPPGAAENSAPIAPRGARAHAVTGNESPAAAAAGTGAIPAESVLWIGHTSQWTHFWFYFFCLLLAAAAIVGMPFSNGWSAVGLALPLVLWLVRWWVTRTTIYELTTQRLKIRRGVFNRRLDELELYRVKDYVMEQPLFLRLVGLGNLTLVSSDASTHAVSLHAIPRVESVREQLRNAVQSERDRKRVRELDIDET